MQKLYYAGIGSRETPDNIMQLMTKAARRLERLGFTLRSGHADGADKAFEAGVTEPSMMEIFIPWPGFNGSTSPLNDQAFAAFEMAKKYHPNWAALKDPVKKLHARNCHQILGKTLRSPSSFVLCWTPDGCESHQDRTSKTGGTGQAISVASDHNIPIFNMFNPDALNRLGVLIDILNQQRQAA